MSLVAEYRDARGDEDVAWLRRVLALRLQRAHEIVEAGREVYNGDPLRKEAGDSLMMKIGEAANRLDRIGVAAPAGVKWSTPSRTGTG